jgi:2-polyprenyl-6-methoxyphenol hydroxylase-like FAD-dependent oxidoreductase
MAVETRTQVLIIGAGPAGATLALLLAQLGVKTMAVSRHNSTANTPRAHIFNQRGMEVLRSAGLEERAKEVATNPANMAHTTWSNTLAGEEYGRMWAWGNKPSEKHRYEMSSPCQMSDLPQSYLEPILVEAAREHGADVRFNTEFVSLADDGQCVLTVLRDRDSGEEYAVRSNYLIGADGARSAVIEAVQIPIDGKQINSAFNVHIRADLTKYMAHRPASLNWVLNPDAPDWSAVGNVRMVRPWHEFVVSMHPALADANKADPDNEMIIKRLKQMIGDPNMDIEVLSTFRWTINDQVARTWQKGRVMCIGDAVHRHPPINGLGSNTCISDAFNVAWKLAYVLRGIASAKLLETLTIERKPIGDAVVRRANEGMLVHRELWSMLGLTPESRAEAMSLLESKSPEGRQARERLDTYFETTDSEFQALGIQMNQIYKDSAAIAPDPVDSPPDTTGFDILKEVVISTYPGYHLPHVWLAASGQTPRISSLDLCAHGSFTLFTGVGGDCWREGVAEIQSSNPDVPIAVFSIGFRCDYMDIYRDWKRVRGVEEDGAVLVRPDQFCSWRYPTSSVESTSLLRRALERVLGHP